MKLKDVQHKENDRSSEFLDPKNEFRRLFAECWGTFLLVLAGAGAVVVAEFSGDISKGMEVVVPGLMVMTIIYFMGSVSGAHINPSVTIAFALRRNFPWQRVPGYLIAQFIGGLLAAALLNSLFGNLGKVGATVPHPDLENWKVFFIELLLTTGLVNTILGTASGPRNVGSNGAIAIGGYIALSGLWAAPLTGASMNAVRTLAPDIIRGDLTTSWIYIAATLLAAFIAVGFEWILKGSPSKHATSEAQGKGSGDKE
jgi:aquaporin Z